MVISASRRSDIPACHADWFFERLRDSYVEVANPMNAKQIRRVDLSRENVDCVVFWSKNPAPMLSRLAELDGYMYYFQYTLNGYGADIEPRVPSLENRVNTFTRLSEALGNRRVLWRYDPILLNKDYTMEFHVNMFGKIAESLRELTRRVTISFVDRYRLINRKLDMLGVVEPTEAETAKLCRALVDIARANNIEICACCESVALSEYGVARASCVDANLIAELLERPIRIPRARLMGVRKTVI